MLEFALAAAAVLLLVYHTGSAAREGFSCKVGYRFDSAAGKCVKKI